MTFHEYQYERPNINALKENFERLLSQLKQSKDENTIQEAFMALNTLRSEFDTQFNIAYIRHTINTKDEFYEAENHFFDETLPIYQALETAFYEAILQTNVRAVLEKKWGAQLFAIAEYKLKTFDDTILEDLQDENKASSEYIKIKAQAKIQVEGKEYNFSTLIPIETGTDRRLRKVASTEKWKFYSQNTDTIEQIFDQLVKVRHRIATKLGYKNFVELGYVRMLRTDYNAEMVTKFRQQVVKYIVPLATELYERQAKRIGLDHLKHYDEEYKFASGNPSPKGTASWIEERAAIMYQELSPETHEFFQFMQNNQLVDWVNREGKATGGYCTYISKYQAPFIFSNFNGTSGDVDVLTHEAGHAFQVYSSRKIGIPEYHFPTYEACEIHSMSMEFFTWQWMKLFFEGDTEKYKYLHLSSSLQFIPYGVAVDEFQHIIYEQPDLTPSERNAVWRTIEKKYLPHRNYENNTFLEEGGFWQKQNHIFNSPFYYIDYTLAQICAFQFWKKDQENHTEAWTDYVRLCQAGGSKSFLDLVALANLRSPFDESCIASVMTTIKDWLAQIDDSKF
jgi:M3 family oligoendopeptidase